MAGPDDLIIGSGFDPSGLDRGLEQALTQITRFQSTVKRASSLGIDPINIDTTKLVASLNKAGISVDQFFAGMKQEITATSAAMKSARFSEELDQIGRAALRAGDGARAWERGMANIRQANAAVVVSHQAHEQSARRAARTLGVLAAQTVGVEGPLGRLAEIALSASAGLGALAVGSVLVIAATKAWELFTKGQREATKAREELAKALSTRLAAGGEPETLSRQIAAAEEKRGLLEKRHLQDITAEISIWGAIKALITDPAETRLKLAQQTREVEAGIALLHRIDANQSLANQQELAAGAENIARAIRSAQEAAARSRQGIAALGPQTFGGEPGVVSEQELAAFRERVELIRRSTTADVQALQVRRGFIESTVVLGKRETDEKQKQLGLLDQEIRLRQQIGLASEAQVKQELALLEAQRETNLLVRAHLERVAKAGGGNLLGQNPLTVVPQTAISNLIFEEQRKAALPLILQGARQQGLVGNGLSQTLTQAERLNKQFNQMRDAVGTFARIGQQLGFINDQGQRTLEVFQGMADAIAQMASGDIFGGILTGLGAIASGFGKTAHEKEIEEAQRRNTEAIDRNTAAQQTAAQQNEEFANVQKAAQKFTKDELRDIHLRSIPTLGGSEEDAQKFAQKLLRSKGTDFASVVRAAERANFQLTDSKGKFSNDLFIQFIKGVANGTIAIDSLTEAADKAAAAMRNIPTGFRVEAARFAAQTPEGGPITITPPNIDPGRTGSAARGNITLVKVYVGGKEIPAVVKTQQERDSMAMHGHPDGAWGGTKWPG